jgi:catechol 2,3-dioxygenase
MPSEPTTSPSRSRESTLCGRPERLESEGIVVAPVDHHVTKSLYFADPDGNALELYADGSDDWKTDPDSLFTPVRKLSL